MSHEVVVNDRMGLVVLTYRGEVTLEERAGVWDEALEQMDPDRAYRVFLDFREAHSQSASIEMTGEVVRRLATEPKLKACRIAYVYPIESSKDRVIESIIRVDPMRFRRFTATRDALQWLFGSLAATRGTAWMGELSRVAG